MGCANHQSIPTGTPTLEVGLPYEVIEFFSEDSTKLTAHLFKPKGKGPFPAVVALHGCAGLFRKPGQMSPRDLEWGQNLSNQGFVAIYPDSFTRRHIDEICKRTDMSAMQREIRPRDAYGALRWLQAQNYVQPDRIALMGWSNGGSSLLSAINQNSPTLPTDLKSDFKIAIAFYPGCKMANKNPQWKNRIPLEILMGTLDNWTPPQFCQSLANRVGGNVHLTLYDGAHHGFDAPHSPMKTLHNLAFVSTVGQTATIGTHEKSRKEAIKKVSEVLNHALSF